MLAKNHRLREAPRSDLPIDTLSIKKAALLLRAVNHPLRQKILRVIYQEGSVKVTTLYKKVKLIQPVTSSHLAILRRAGVVATKREGRCIYYGINHERMEQLLHSLEELFRPPH